MALWNGPGINVSFLPSLSAGNNNIGDVDIASAIPQGSNEIGKVVISHIQGTWTITQDSSAGEAQTLTKSAVTGQRHYITAIEIVISGADLSTDVTILLKDGVTTKWKELIGNGSKKGSNCGIVFPFPIEMSANTDAVLEIAAGGASVVTTGNLSGYTK